MTNLHLARITGCEFLHEKRKVIATKPDPCKQPDLPCPQCHAALTVRASRIRVSTIIYHPLSRCAWSERCWHRPTLDRDAAIRGFMEETK